MDDLKILKKNYGEKFAHLCRTLFPTLLEKEGLLSTVMLNNFEPTKKLYETLTASSYEYEFQKYINDRANYYVAEKKIDKTSTPEQLLEDAGYILYPECKTEQDIQYFKKYYAKNEEICTFDGNRLNTCRVWFAVRTDVDLIKREDFEFPKRQDRYGTSVISIQFTKLGNFLSIKNRYNHMVKNPDATFGNNLDNIVEGLTDAFERTYGVKANSESAREFNLRYYNFVRDNNGKWYPYVERLREIYVCENNIVIKQGKPYQYDKNSTVFISNYCVDLKQKTIVNLFDETKSDVFLDTFNSKIKDITVTKNENVQESDIKEIKTDADLSNLGDYKTVTFLMEDGNVIKIKFNKNNEILGYYNEKITKIGDDFLALNSTLREFNAPNLEEIGQNFFYLNNRLTVLKLPKLNKVGANFVACNTKINELDVPNLEYIGDNFLGYNDGIELLTLPKAKQIGNLCMFFNNNLKGVNLPKVEKIGDNFLIHNKTANVVSMPNVKMIGCNFMRENKRISPQKLVDKCPNLSVIKVGFLGLKTSEIEKLSSKTIVYDDTNELLQEYN